MIVVDASIIVKGFLAEPRSAQALAFLIRFDGQLYGPDLLTIEVAKALVAAANARRVGHVQARGAIDRWLARVDRDVVRLHPTDTDLLRSATALAIELVHPLGDCIYLALADRLGCPFATADAKFRDRVGDPARVRLLDELV